jgi:hypothetical protein
MPRNEKKKRRPTTKAARAAAVTRHKRSALDQIPRDELHKVIVDNLGLLTQAAAHYGLDRETLADYILKHPELKKAQDEGREKMLDMGEQSLVGQVRAGNIAAICFTMKCLGKQRGYIERMEFTGSDGKDISVSLLWPQFVAKT